jgi:hypothetical protein
MKRTDIFFSGKLKGMRQQRSNSGGAGNQKTIITEWSGRSLLSISGKLKATFKDGNSSCGGNRQSVVITSGAVGELERMRMKVPK